MTRFRLEQQVLRDSLPQTWLQQTGRQSCAGFEIMQTKAGAQAEHVQHKFEDQVPLLNYALRR